jgi:sialate O-acetylesterase
MTVNMDIGEANDIHPKNKQEIGRRLSLWALAKVYGKDLPYAGPFYEKQEINGAEVTLTFKNTSGGLVARGGDLKGFAVAGADKKWAWATAKIDGDKVVISSPEVKEPVAVRYAWGNNPECNLTNAAGLLASPFRTDDWQ